VINHQNNVEQYLAALSVLAKVESDQKKIPRRNRQIFRFCRSRGAL